MTLGQKIKKLRNEKGLTQKDLANLVNVTFQTVSKWENDENEPDVSTLRRLSQLFGCSMDDLLSEEEVTQEEKPIEEPTPQTAVIHQREMHVCERCNQDIPFDDLVFTAENADNSSVMTYNNCTYNPSDSFQKWERVMKVYRQDSTEETITALAQLEEELPEFKNLLFSWQISLLAEYNKYQELIKFVEENMDYLNSYPKDGMDYSNMLYMYMASLNNTYQPMKAIQIFAGQADNIPITTYLVYQYGYANYLMMDLCTTQYEYEMYKQAAIEVFTILQQYNYEMPGLIQNWMKIVH